MTRPLLALALILAPVPGAVAADPVADALALVPPDPAIVLVVRDLRGHAARVAASPFADWVRASPAGKAFVASPDFTGLKDANAFVTAFVGVTPQQVLDDILGDAVVLTYTPAGQGAGEHAAVYLRPRSPERLAGVVAKLTALQTAGGELLKTDTRSHAGRDYTARTKPGGAADFVAERDGVFLYTSHEPAVRDFLTRAPDTAHADRLAKLGAADRLLACVFRPRAFDAQLAANLKAAADPGEKAFLAQFQKVWAAADAVAVTAHTDSGVDLGVRVTYRPDALPAELRALVEPAGAPGPFAPVPAGSLAAVRLRLPAPALLSAAGSFLPPDGKAALDKWVADTVGPAVGRDHLPAVLAGFGPEVSVTVDPPAPGAGWVPAWTVAVRLPDAKTHGPVLQAADTFARLARFESNRQNRDQLTLSETPRPDGPAVRTVAGPGLLTAPSYSVVASHLVVAADPARVAAFTPPAGPDPPPLVRVSGGVARDYLRAHGDRLAAWSAARDNKPVADVKRDLAALADLLDAVDRADLLADTAPGRAGLTLRVTPAKPLRK